MDPRNTASPNRVLLAISELVLFEFIESIPNRQRFQRTFRVILKNRSACVYIVANKLLPAIREYSEKVDIVKASRAS
jgi:hypothetical protein